MIVASTLFALGVLAALLGGRRPRLTATTAAVLLVGAAVVDALDGLDLRLLADAFAGLDLLALAGDAPTSRALLLGALVWCGPAADVVVRAALRATALPAPEDAAAAGVQAGRWIGRLERWMLLLVVAAGQPALAIIPTGGKALLRYAEAVADARAGRQRLVVPGRDGDPGRDAFLDYVLVGSLASWTQAIVLGLVVAG